VPEHKQVSINQLSQTYSRKAAAQRAPCRQSRVNCPRCN
jgi:hypothetical protein